MTLRALYDVAAPAKLNLFLHVVGRRDDGYHLLQSAFVLIDWCDTLHFEPRADGAIRRHDIGAALPDDDLTLRAARALQRASGTTLGADITVDKQVPWGAGLGGGSSDAASALLALNRLWRLDWPLSRLLALGLALGADVPFFLGGHDAWVEGIGERLAPLALPPHWYAVVKPPASIATAAIFSSPLLRRDSEAATLAGFLAEVGGEGDSEGPAKAHRALLSERFRNDLQRPAEAECPEVAQAARLLEARFGHSRMTGSGSAVFAGAGFAGPGHAPVASLPDLPAGWAGRICRGLQCHPLVGWAAGRANGFEVRRASDGPV